MSDNDLAGFYSIRKRPKECSEQELLDFEFPVLTSDLTRDLENRDSENAPDQNKMFLELRLVEPNRKINPVLAVEAFLAARELGVYPPLWALDWLTENFQKYYDAQGLRPMDDFLGLGGPKPFKKLMTDELRFRVCREMWHLISVFDLSIVQAAQMISRRMETTHWNRTDHRLVEFYSVETLEKYYTEFSKTYLPRWPEYVCADPEELLSHYPDGIPR